MRDHAIAPTAQRLAEENNVDWRVLEGSGEGGSVVERDVLGYLARVMSGEEATNPTPEPLPEGLSAWPEEPERRRNTQGQSTRSQSTRSQSAPPSRNAPKTTPERADHRSANRGAKETDPGIMPFTVPAPVTVTKPTPEAEPNTPWTVEKPAGTTGENAAKAADPAASFGAVASDVAAGVNGVTPQGAARKDAKDKGAASDSATAATAKAPETVAQSVPEVARTAQPDETVADAPPASSSAKDASRDQVVLAELETLKARVAELEEERSRHVNELHQLSRMQETIALQKNEGAKLGALQSEVRDLKAQLTAAQRAGERVEALAAHNRDLESRLVRARNFKSKAKIEFERITEDNMMLEHELADLKRSKRGLFRRKN